MGDQPFFGLLSQGAWQSAIGGVSTVSAWCLTVAMASVGLGSQLSRLRVLGLRPLAAGLVAALVVGVLSAGLILALGPALESLALSVG